jgi:hypothetical protein
MKGRTEVEAAESLFGAVLEGGKRWRAVRVRGKVLSSVGCYSVAVLHWRDKERCGGEESRQTRRGEKTAEKKESRQELRLYTSDGESVGLSRTLGEVAIPDRSRVGRIERRG